MFHASGHKMSEQSNKSEENGTRSNYTDHTENRAENADAKYLKEPSVGASDFQLLKWAKERNPCLLDLLKSGHLDPNKCFSIKTTLDCECCLEVNFDAEVTETDMQLLSDGACACSRAENTEEAFVVCQFSLIHVACARHDLELMQELIAFGVDVNAWTLCKGKTMVNALHLALRCRDVDCVRELLKAEARPDGLDSQGRSAVYLACQNLILDPECQMKKDMFDLVVEQNKMSGTSDTGYCKEHSALLLAVFKGNHYVVGRLLEIAPVPVWVVWHTDSQSPLSVAIMKDDEAMVKLLVDAVDAKQLCLEDHPYSPLCMALSYSMRSVSVVLLESGCDPNSVDEYGRTPLHLATRSPNCVDLIKLIVDKGGNVNQVSDAYSVPPLLILFSHTRLHNTGKIQTAVEDLLHAGADVEFTDPASGMTALHLSVIQWQPITVLETLLKYGASIDARSHTGNTPLSLAAHLGYREQVLFLVEKGANIHTLDKCNNTLLHFFAYYGSLSMTKWYLDLGGDAHIRDRTGSNALWYAACGGNIEIVKVLLQQNVSMDGSSVGINLDAVREYRWEMTSYEYMDIPRNVLELSFITMDFELMELFLFCGSYFSKTEITNFVNEFVLEDDDLDSSERETVRDMLNYAQEYLGSPTTLQRLCRTTVRKCIPTKNFTSLVKSLDIPESVKDFIVCQYL